MESAFAEKSKHAKEGKENVTEVCVQKLRK